MSDRILQISTFDIRAGRLEAFKESVRKAVLFAEAEGPQLWVQTYIDEAEMRAHSCQIMADSEAILRHWRMSDPYISDVMETCVMRRLEIYGQPTDEVLRGLEPLKSQGVKVVVTPEFFGFQERGSVR